MHIAINAQLLSLSQNYRNGGISRYIRYLLTELAKRPGQHEYTIFVNGREVVERLQQITGKDSVGLSREEDEHEGWGAQTQITYIPVSWPESKPISRVTWEQLKLPSLVREKHIDVLHSPANVLPEMLPRSCAGVVTLHDLAFLRYPHVLTRSKRLYHRTFTIRSLQRASLIITVSDSTKTDAHELVDIPYERLTTVYPCIDERFSNVPEEDTIKTFREQKGLSDGFLLYLSTLEPRKNIPAIIDAYARLRQKYGVREKLVLAGGKGWLYDAIFAKVQQLGLETEVLFPGFVTDAEQTLWYRAASAFVYPSLYEGFGIPVAEALACGVPVVTSTISSLPEAGAGIALCVDPHDVEALTEACYQALTDPLLRAKCHDLAPSVAQKFSAHAMTEGTIAAYEQAARVQDHTAIAR